MGLDMYMRAELYVSDYEWVSDLERSQYRAVCDALGVEATPRTPALTVSVTVAYWRKANAIHKWFVDNCQDGIDECQESYVSRDQVEDLISLCQRVIDTRNPSLLPSQQGFFFGTYDYDEWYYADLKETVKMLTWVLEQFDDRYIFSYQSSW